MQPNPIYTTNHVTCIIRALESLDYHKIAGMYISMVYLVTRMARDAGLASTLPCLYVIFGFIFTIFIRKRVNSPDPSHFNTVQYEITDNPLISREYFPFTKHLVIGNQSFTVPNDKFIWVTAYFQLSQGSKHSAGSFTSWITSFLNGFTGELFFFTTTKQMQFYRTITNRTNIHFITKYEEVWDIPCVSGMRELYKEQNKLYLGMANKEALFAIWNSKICLVKEISELFPKSIVMWIDAGSRREKRYKGMEFPNRERMWEIFPSGTTRGEMVFAMYKLWMMHREPNMTFVSKNLAIGGFLGGDYLAIHKFYDEFWRIHKYYGERKEYIGQDQYVFSTYMLYVGDSWVVPNFRSERGCNKWFATFSYFGDVNKCFRGREPLRKISGMVRKHKYTYL